MGVAGDIEHLERQTDGGYYSIPTFSSKTAGHHLNPCPVEPGYTLPLQTV